MGKDKGTSTRSFFIAVALCLLVMPSATSMALGAGAYYCTETPPDTNTLAAIKANENFVLRLTPTKITITVKGRGSNDCHLDGKLDDGAVLSCDTGKAQYTFNFATHRFIEIFGANNDTPLVEKELLRSIPHVARGLCAKISQP